ncbi:low temperature requirement protein A [Plantactinospora siamensis]|uniref:Low temperature requirement protein A n=1 Tax=Plantactinospora siamensis TaxID=555372 RepID=A0ABV6NZC8_9ACTN
MSSRAGNRRTGWFVPAGPGSRVTRLELLYDLVFVYAFVNLANTLSHRVTAGTLLAGGVVLALLWYCWSSFALLGNAVRADQGLIPVAGAAIMVLAFVLALTIPEAFVDRSGGLPGPVAFAVCYLAVRLITTGAYWLVPGATGRPARQIWALSAPGLAATALILAAALLPHAVARPGGAAWLRLGLWLAAVLVEYAAGFALPYARLAVTSAGHWAERHGQIVLIALGESVLSLGVGAGLGEGLTLTWPVVGTAALGVVLIALLWWSYFDTLASSVEQAMHGTRGQERITLGRDAYTYLHLPLIAGVIGTALGLKLIVGAAAAPDRSQPHTVEVAVLYVGVALYILSVAAVVFRTFRTIRYASIGTAALLAALAVPASRLPAVAALALLTAIGLSLTLVHRFVGAAARTRVREAALHEQEAVEAATNRWRGTHL